VSRRRGIGRQSEFSRRKRGDGLLTAAMHLAGFLRLAEEDHSLFNVSPPGSVELSCNLVANVIFA